MWDLIVSVPDHCLSFYFPMDDFAKFQPHLMTDDKIDKLLA